MPDELPDLHHARLLQALDSLILERYGSFKEAEARTGVRRITLRQWRQGSRRPSFHRILATLARLKIDLVDVVRRAGSCVELIEDPVAQLRAVLPRRRPEDEVLARAAKRLSTLDFPERARWIPSAFFELELLLDRDPRIARVEMEEYLVGAHTVEAWAAGLCLWAMWLNSRSRSIDAGVAVLNAFKLTEPDSPLFHILLSTSASVCKNLRALRVGKVHAERSILGFLRAGDTENGARSLLRLGIIEWALEDYVASDSAYRDAVALAPGSRFASMCLFNMVYNDLAQGRMQGALDHIEANRESLAAIPPAYALRMHWLSAKVLAGCSRQGEAAGELCFALAHADLAQEDPQVVFQVFFEAAELLVGSGRLGELRSLVPRLRPLVVLEDECKERVAASRAFLRLVRGSGLETMTPEEVRHLARYRESDGMSA